MPIIKYLLIGLCLAGNVIFAQHYLTGGVGLVVGLYNSDGLDRFVTTYNDINYPVLINPVSNFNHAFGVRWEIGYRYLRDISAAALIGYQSYNHEDMSEFSNGEQRTFELSFNNIFFEGELGYKFDNFLVGGLVGFYLNRNVTMETIYNGAAPRSLTGKYRSETGFSSDIGISFGVQKKPFFLIGKITYPFYTSGSDDRLIDNNPGKVTDNLHKYPDDYRAYVAGERYDGVATDIDGMKFLITLSYAFQIGE